MATFADLKAAVSRDIRDHNQVTFNDQTVGDLVNLGMNEVGKVYPREVITDIALTALTYEYTLPHIQTFRVEWLRDGTFNGTILSNEDISSQGGWEVFAGQLHLPKGIVDGMNVVTDVVRAWGYAGRARLIDDADIAELDDVAEWAVRSFARWSAYQALNAERALFKQWQATSQNSDISEPQLLALVNLYADAWKRERAHLKTLRRV